ncbi:sigma-70 family RNA polymerase sigma factor [Stieleria sp. JC731]|uniref:sigma-70 family RNA polymerase sigma factor n=1 Tax=Pirellulaceae TaxID=2691357 RepID=UPI001E5DAD7F|nr:sigma-70 family RNA polymerase sigma factor [Stieleria sp. JC731]MCC9599408.1 sigma-70 family RNA polymerase sigma factor [Stieleria sp. JC731]
MENEIADESRLQMQLSEDPDSTLAELFCVHRASFNNLLTFRMDRRLAGRVDPDDILQEAFLAAKARLKHYLANEKHTVFAWLRMIVIQTMVDVHRRHLGAGKRSAQREIKLSSPNAHYPQTTAVSIADRIAAQQTTPSGVAVRGEELQVLEKAIATLTEQDQEIIAMRHFESLSNKQVSEVLGLSVTAASNRYVRALERLREVLEGTGLGLQ